MTKKSLKFTTQEKARILNKVLSKQIKQKEAWEILWVSDRQVRNLLKLYQEYWENWLEHWLKWKTSNHRLKKEDENIIKDVIKEDRLQGCKPIFVTEKLNECYWVEVSKETVRKIMIENHVRYKKSKKKYEYRIRRPRRNYYGEMIQFDWSYHKRISEQEEDFCLLVAIDDATWKLIKMKLWDNEWYEAVSEFRMEYLQEYGVPKSIYLDKFSTYKVNYPKASETKDVRTNFDRSMNKLGCQLISANSPQAKWRVERVNQTLQDRLIHELIFNGIHTLEEANIYIETAFIPQYNEKFWVTPNCEWNLHRKLNLEEKNNLEWIFAKESLRSLGYDYIIQYKNHFYQTKTSPEYTIYPKKKLLVAENNRWDIRIYAWSNSQEKLVFYEELSYNAVKSSRAKYFWERHRIEREKVKLAIKQRKEQRFKESKEKQRHYKVQRLIDKLE